MTAIPPEVERSPGVYSALIRAYPARWRADGRGDELLGVLLETAAAAGRTRPTAAEAADLVIHGFAERMRFVDTVLPTASRAHIAQASLAAGAGLSTFLLIGGEVRIPGFSDGESPRNMDDILRPTWGPFLTLGVAIYIAWIAALGRYIEGSMRGARELVLVAGSITVAVPLLSDVTNHQRPPGGLLLTLAVLAFGAALLPADITIKAWSRFGPLAAALVLVAALVAWRVYELTVTKNFDWTRSNLSSRTMFYWSPNGDQDRQVNRAIDAGAAIVVGTLVVGALILWYRDRTWLPAALFLVVPAFTLRLGTSLYTTAHATRDAALWSAAAIGVIVLNGVIVTRLLNVPWRRSARRRWTRQAPKSLQN